MNYFIINDKKSKYQNMDERKKARIMYVSSKNSKNANGVR